MKALCTVPGHTVGAGAVNVGVGSRHRAHVRQRHLLVFAPSSAQACLVLPQLQSKGGALSLCRDIQRPGPASTAVTCSPLTAPHLPRKAAASEATAAVGEAAGTRVAGTEEAWSSLWLGRCPRAVRVHVPQDSIELRGPGPLRAVRAARSSWGTMSEDRRPPLVVSPATTVPSASVDPF